MADRSRDWFCQAEHDLAQAQDSRAAGRHDWACFAAHQAAEKATKALHLASRQEAWGHVVTRLLYELPASLKPPPELLESARVLDNYYIPTRYPNAHSEGAAFEHYGPNQSEQALNAASAIIAYIRSRMA